MNATTYQKNLAQPTAVWGAVASMALCVADLIASEFMPVSLLTPIAGDLALTEGQAGQAISVLLGAAGVAWFNTQSHR